VGASRRSILGGFCALGALPMLAKLQGTAYAAASGAARRATHALRFDKPAGRWMEALPVGNGRLGAMVFGGVTQERVQLNHIELWSGHPSNDDRPETLAALPKVRELLFAGRYAEANTLAQDKMMAPKNSEAFGSYQMLGDLGLEFEHAGNVTNYERELDMAAAEVRVRYRLGMAEYKRTVIASHPDRALVICLETTAPEGLSFRVTLSRDRDAEVGPDGDSVRLAGRPQPSGTAFAAHMRCVADEGQVTPTENGYQVRGARRALIYLTGATDLLADRPAARSRADMEHVVGQPWDAFVAFHQAEHAAFYEAVELELGPLPEPITADARLNAVKTGANDNALTEAYFNFGRYLLIRSSRPGSLPPNLQGLWADGFSPPWSADYHININIQMNFWPAEVCGLGTLHGALFDFAERLKPDGETTARIAYGCRGAAAHYTSNPWGHTALDGNVEYGLWPEGLAWLSLHFWEHYLYSRDVEFLRTRAYPFLKSCAEFTLDYLVTHPVTGKLVSGPAASPENRYRLATGETGWIAMGCAMSQSMAHAVLTQCAQAAADLGTDAGFAKTCHEAVLKLDRLRIGPDGRIMEWPEPFEEVEPGHRHISHLFGLYPGAEIDPRKTPELAEAARKTLAGRLEHGGGHTGWSAAWLVMFRARLGEGDEAHQMLQKLFREITSDNYLDMYTASTDPIFQIDGNLGATAAIVEMLVQSHNDTLRILPALPTAWASGKATGIRGRGGLVVDLAWDDGLVRTAVVRATRDVDCEVIAPPRQRLLGAYERGRNIVAVAGAPSFKAGRTYDLEFAEA